MVLNEVISLQALKAEALNRPLPQTETPAQLTVSPHCSQDGSNQSLKVLTRAQCETISSAVCSWVCACVAMYLSCCQPDIDKKRLDCVCLGRQSWQGSTQSGCLQAGACLPPWRVTAACNQEQIPDQTALSKSAVKGRRNWKTHDWYF